MGQSLFLKKLQAWGQQLYQKRDSGTEHLWTTAFVLVHQMFCLLWLTFQNSIEVLPKPI